MTHFAESVWGSHWELMLSVKCVIYRFSTFVSCSHVCVFACVVYFSFSFKYILCVLSASQLLTFLCEQTKFKHLIFLLNKYKFITWQKSGCLINAYWARSLYIYERLQLIILLDANKYCKKILWYWWMPFHCQRWILIYKVWLNHPTNMATSDIRYHLQ